MKGLKLESLSKYGRLHMIEDAFRVHKTNLEIRPVFHWKERRLQSHIVLCSMSFAIIRNLQYGIGLVFGEEKISGPRDPFCLRYQVGLSVSLT